MILQLLSYAGIALGFCLLVMLIATTLYYISEELEAHTVSAKRHITRSIYGIMGIHILLWIVDGLPFFLTCWSLFSNYIYLRVMASFPVVEHTSGIFILACISATLNHFLWFWHFNDDDLPPYTIYDRDPLYEGETLPPFSQVASFFGILVWTVPFLLFLSLSANDNALPVTTDHGKLKRKGLARVTLENAWLYIVNLAYKVLPKSLVSKDEMYLNNAIPRY